MVEFIQKVFGGLFLVLNPLVIVPIYLAITGKCSVEERRSIAIKSCLFALSLLLAATLFGKSMLRAISVSNEALVIAGGFLLFYVGFQMVVSKESNEKNDSSNGPNLTDVAIFPLGFPIITGPGALTLTMSYIAEAPNEWVYTFIVMGMISAIIGLVYATLVFSSFIFKLLGKGGISIVQRIIGLIIVAFAMQMIIEGVKESVTHFEQAKTAGQQ